MWTPSTAFALTECRLQANGNKQMMTVKNWRINFYYSIKKQKSEKFWYNIGYDEGKSGGSYVWGRG